MESEHATIRQQAVAQVANLTKNSLTDVFGESLGLLKQIMDIVRGIATVKTVIQLIACKFNVLAGSSRRRVRRGSSHAHLHGEGQVSLKPFLSY